MMVMTMKFVDSCSTPYSSSSSCCVYFHSKNNITSTRRCTNNWMQHQNNTTIKKMSSITRSLNFSCIFYHITTSLGIPKIKKWLPPPRCLDSSSWSTSKEEALTLEEALAEILEQEFGASKEDSVHIAHNCPNYLAMLLLDDDTLQPNTLSRAIDKEKLISLAKQKGDNGMVPFLESLGLRLPSATHLARSLFSHRNPLTLPGLILKVQYVKEIFFSNTSCTSSSHEGNDDNDNYGRLIATNAKRMTMHLSISVDDDVQHTLAFFEKIEAKRGGLNMLASADSSLSSLLESFPRILLLPLESSVVSVVGLLEYLGVPKQDMGKILLLFPPIVFYDINKVLKPRLQAFEKVGANKKDLSRMLIKYPWILSAAIQENYENILDFFESEKVPKVGIGNAIKSWPILLGCSVTKLKVMVKTFGELGVGNKTLGKVIATSPQLLLRNAHDFLQVVSYLKDLGVDEEGICKALGRCPELFATSTDKTLERKLVFLASIGVYKSHLPRIISKYPEFFVCDVDKSLRPRIKFLLKSGLSRRDVAFMVRKFSPLLGYSISKVLSPKLDFLVNTMGKPLKDVVEYPRYFSYSLEKKIKPRYWVLKGRNIECSLIDMLGKNDEEFASEFMLLPPDPSPVVEDR